MTTFQHTSGKRLGKRAPRIDSRTLKLSDYLTLPRAKVTAPEPPPEVSWVMEVPNWDMLGNDTLGDCVEADQLHMVQQWSHYAGTEVVPTTAEAIALYGIEGGYVPGDPNTDNGTVILDALNNWRQHGITAGGKNHKILAYVAVNWLNATEVQTAIQLFGNAMLGIQLPISAQSQTAWTVPDGGPNGDGSPGSWGGHCIPIMARSPETATCITWGARLKMSHNFFTDYVDECYAVLSSDWLEANGLSPSGFNLAQLQADLKAVTA